MHVVYTRSKSGFKPGYSYRNPRFFAGPEGEATEVTVLEDYPEIINAYRKAGVKVNFGGETEDTSDETEDTSDDTGDEEETSADTEDTSEAPVEEEKSRKRRRR